MTSKKTVQFDVQKMIKHVLGPRFAFQPLLFRPKQLQGAIMQLGTVVAADGNGVETNADVCRRVVLAAPKIGHFGKATRLQVEDLQAVQVLHILVIFQHWHVAHSKNSIKCCIFPLRPAGSEWDVGVPPGAQWPCVAWAVNAPWPNWGPGPIHYGWSWCNLIIIYV